MNTWRLLWFGSFVLLVLACYLIFLTPHMLYGQIAFMLAVCLDLGLFKGIMRQRLIVERQENTELKRRMNRAREVMYDGTVSTEDIGAFRMVVADALDGVRQDREGTG